LAFLTELRAGGALRPRARPATGTWGKAARQAPRSVPKIIIAYIDWLAIGSASYNSA